MCDKQKGNNELEKSICGSVLLYVPSIALALSGKLYINRFIFIIMCIPLIIAMIASIGSVLTLFFNRDNCMKWVKILERTAYVILGMYIALWIVGVYL